ncbi:hypothetical protein MBAV_006082 [Candidatus Magnetobacterium bavaricum]|uniref:Uncharacterized protein n=1 Tax=Candidatus Magnetobacterium bavaricum TaxID=29290 RepID=A0A0F3GIK2_9BACT|nr:hypothetical protein MBAV_006082 [Candidatus Magnetobacterium bavaricum]
MIITLGGNAARVYYADVGQVVECNGDVRVFQKVALDGGTLCLVGLAPQGEDTKFHPPVTSPSSVCL